MKNVELTAEEIELVKQFRKKQLTKNDKTDLEKEYKTALNAIKAQLQIADTAVCEAVKISEEHGVPFTMCLSCMPASRDYGPETFKEKWGHLDPDFLEELGVVRFDQGWEYWNTSSFYC